MEDGQRPGQGHCMHLIICQGYCCLCCRLLSYPHQINASSRTIMLHPSLHVTAFRRFTWKSSSSKISFRHLIKNAAHTYKWKWENPSGSDWRKHNTEKNHYYALFPTASPSYFSLSMSAIFCRYCPSYWVSQILLGLRGQFKIRDCRDQALPHPFHYLLTHIPHHFSWDHSMVVHAPVLHSVQGQG